MKPLALLILLLILTACTASQEPFPVGETTIPPVGHLLYCIENPDDEIFCPQEDDE